MAHPNTDRMDADEGAKHEERAWKGATEGKSERARENLRECTHDSDSARASKDFNCFLFFFHPRARTGEE